MIKVVFMDIDDTIFNFSAFVKKTMKEGYENLMPEQSLSIGIKKPI